MTTIQLDAKLGDVFPEYADTDEPWTEERIGHEIATLGGTLRAAFNLPKIEYAHGSYVYYKFDVPEPQATAILELMRTHTLFNAEVL